MERFLGCQNTLIAFIEFFYCQYCSSITPMLSTLLNLLSDLCINHWKTLQSQNEKISIFSISLGTQCRQSQWQCLGWIFTLFVIGLSPHQLWAGSHRQHAHKKWWREEMDIWYWEAVSKTTRLNWQQSAVRAHRVNIWPRKLDNEIVLHAIVGMRRDFSHYVAGPWDIKENWVIIINIHPGATNSPHYSPGAGVTMLQYAACQH